MRTTDRPGLIAGIVLLALGAISLLLAAAWNDRLVAMIFNAGQAVSYHFAPIVSLARTVVLVKGLVLILAGALVIWRRHAVSRWMRKHRPTLLNIATLIVTITVLIIIAEAVARIAFRGETYDGGGAGLKDQLARIEYNSRGFRDIEYPVEKGNATVILVLGDSFTFGQGIANASDLWTEVLERDLNVEREVRVINTGQNGFQTYDEWRVLNDSLDLEPDIVILQYFFNDAETNGQLLRPARAAEATSAWYKLKKGMHLFLYSNSYLYSFSYVRWQNAKINLGLAESYPEAINNVYRERAGELGMHEQQLLGVRETAQDAGAKFVLLIVPANYDFSSYPLMDGHRFMARFCEENDVECIDLLPEFMNEDWTLTRVSPYDSHPSAYGHALIAKALQESATFKSALESS